MDLQDLRIFKTVVQEGGITRAAQRLHRVQSNVTTRIRNLEQDLGIALFIREGKRLHLAPAGRTLLDYADRLLALADEARMAVVDDRPRGALRLGSMESTAAIRLPQLLAAYAERYPEVQLELRTGNPVVLSQALLSGEIDAAFVAEPAADKRFGTVVAFEEQPVLVTGSGSNDAADPTAMPRTIIVFENGCPHRRRLEEWLADRGAVPERIIELGSYHAMLGCVLAGMGAALLPKSVLDTFPEAHRLQVHDLTGAVTRLNTLLIWRKDTTSANVTALAGLLAPVDIPAMSANAYTP